MATSGTSTESSSMYSSADGDVVVSNVNLTSLSVNNYYSNGSSMTSHQSMLGGGSIGGKSNERLVVMDDEDDDDDQALIDKILPRELLLKVFSFLDVVSLCRAAQVSRAWNSLALDGSNWQRVDLFSFQTEVNSPVIQRLSSRTGGFLHAISLRGCRSLTDDALAELARSCPNLEVLDLNDCKNLTDATCEAIATYCSNLVSLNLSGLSITDRSLHSLSTSEPLALKLSHLNLSFCSALTWRGLLKLLAGPASFQSSLSNNSSVASNATTTSTLTNNWTNGTTSASSSTNNFFHSPSSSYHHHPHLHRQRRPYSALRFFAAKMCVNMITDTSVTALTWAAGSNLRTLLLNGCNNLTDEGVSAIGSNSPNLSTLALSSCTHLTDASLQSLASGTPQLKTLEVASCSQLTDAGVTALARGCHQLTRLDLEELVQLTDASISVLATQCPNLSTLSLSHCELITDEGLRALSQGTSNPPLLKVLELDNCPLITDEGLSHLSRLTSLQRLEIYDCQQLSRPGIRMIRAALPFLKIHAYFASVTPTQQANGDGQGIGGPGGGAGAGNPNDPLDPAHRAGRTICRCCSIL